MASTYVDRNALSDHVESHLNAGGLRLPTVPDENDILGLLYVTRDKCERSTATQLRLYATFQRKSK